MRPYEAFEEVVPGIKIRHAEGSRAYRSGKVWRAGGPKGESTRDGAALLTGIAFAGPKSAERFLAKLVERTGITEEATGLELSLLCSKRQTYRTWGHHNPFKVLGGRRVARIVLYRWSLGTLVHEFAHHVDFTLNTGGRGYMTHRMAHGPKFYEVLEELHAIAFEIMGTTEAAEYERLQERINVEEATRRALAEKFDRSAEALKPLLKAA